MTPRQIELIRFALQFCDAYHEDGDVAMALEDEFVAPVKLNEFRRAYVAFNEMIERISPKPLTSAEKSV